jgi:hypothetical protein
MLSCRCRSFAAYRLAAAGIFLEQRLAVLDNKKRSPTMFPGIPRRLADRGRIKSSGGQRGGEDKNRKGFHFWGAIARVAWPALKPKISLIVRLVCKILEISS